MTYTSRRLGPDDLEALKGLRALFAEAFDDTPAYKDVVSEAYLRAMLADTKTSVLVAQDEQGVVVGGLVAYELHTVEREACDIYLYDLAVAEAHRRKGIATQLIAMLKEIARGVGAHVIFVQADNVDKPALALYTKLARNIEDDITHFEIPIE